MPLPSYSVSRSALHFYRLWPLVLAILLLAGTLLAPARAVHAQTIDWREQRTSHFTILYSAGQEAIAQEYVGFTDEIYEEIATIFSHRTATPIILRLYPTLESYYQVNPLARNTPGVVAHADFRRREVVVVIEQTLSQTPTEIQNNIRHELTHIVIAELSENRLNTGFHEGVAQYVEHQSRELEARVELLRRTVERNDLMPWSDFDERDSIYTAPQRSYPQVLSVVAFLVDQHGFGKLREFVVNSARSSGYRSALESTYGVPATELEAQWQAWLPSYLNGGYRLNALTSYDMSYPRQLLDQGLYAEAQAEVEQAIAWLRRNPATQDSDQLAEAERLLILARGGQRAERLMLAARNALETADYEQAQQLIAQARDVYAALGDTRQDAIIAAYTERVNRGLSARTQLQQASELSRSLRFPEARAALDAAAAEFAALGDASRLESALTLRQAMDSRQQLAGYILVAIGLAGIAFGVAGRFFQRDTEIW